MTPLLAVTSPRGGALHSEKGGPWHRDRLAVVYVRQSTVQQVLAHQESTRLQYGLVDRAQALGWAADRVLVIDEDLGRSGTRADERAGFQRLVSEVSLDHVGLILGLEMSRLARSDRDWYQLLELCALFRTLIADLDGVYDPAQYNDRLLLGLNGTLSEAELHVLKQRMHEGRRNKARRGELRFALPIGYVWGPEGTIGFDPDEQVPAVVRLVFRKFAELGTLHGVLRYLADHQIQLGIRVREGPGKGELVWRRPNRMTLQTMLKHPLYAGAYAYGRRQRIPDAAARGSGAAGGSSWRVRTGWPSCPPRRRPIAPGNSTSGTRRSWRRTGPGRRARAPCGRAARCSRAWSAAAAAAPACSCGTRAPARRPPTCARATPATTARRTASRCPPGPWRRS